SMRPTMPRAIIRASNTSTNLAVDMIYSLELNERNTAPQDSREQIALRVVLLDFLVDPLRVLGQSAFDPARVLEDGLRSPRRVALDRGGEPLTDVVLDPTADRFRVDRAQVGHRRQRAQSHDSQAVDERERLTLALRVGENPAQRVYLLVQRCVGITEIGKLLEQAPVKQHHVFFRPLHRRFIVEDVLQGGALGVWSQILEENRLASCRLQSNGLSESKCERPDTRTRVHHHCLPKEK